MHLAFLSKHICQRWLYPVLLICHINLTYINSLLCYLRSKKVENNTREKKSSNVKMIKPIHWYFLSKNHMIRLSCEINKIFRMWFLQTILELFSLRCVKIDTRTSLVCPRTTTHSNKHSSVFFLNINCILASSNKKTT